MVDAAGRPVGGAMVLAAAGPEPFDSGWPSFGISRADGSFVLADLPAGSLQVKAVAGWLASPVVKTTAALGEAAFVELLLPGPASLEIRVLDPRGKPVGAAEVFGVNPTAPRSFVLDVFVPTAHEDEMSRLGSTDSEGRLRLDDLSPGTYDLAAKSPGFAAATLRQVRVGQAANDGADGADGEAGGKPVEIVLRPAAVAKGRVVDDEGRVSPGRRSTSLRSRTAPIATG